MVLTLLELGEEGTFNQPLAHVQVGVGQPDVHLRVGREMSVFSAFFLEPSRTKCEECASVCFFPAFFFGAAFKVRTRRLESFLYSRTAQAPPGPLHLHTNTQCR